MKKLRHVLPVAFLIAALIVPLVPATPVYASTLDRQVGASTDDVWTRADDYWNLAHTDVRAGAWAAEWQEGAGMRFTNITVPQGYYISEAHLTVTCHETTSGGTPNTRISASDEDDAATFSSLANFRARWAARTTARVDWDSIPNWTIETEYNSPDIKTVIQEIIDRGGWNSGQDIVIFWDDFEDRTAHAANNIRFAYSWDATAAKAAELHIEYTANPPAVTTSAATLVEETTATLNANLTSLGDYTPVYAYFQHGLTTGYGTDTTKQTKTGTGTYSQAIEDLSPGTTYHFRAAVKYNTSYVYGGDATLNTKPLACSGVGTTTGETSVTLTWTKGTGADKTTIRRSTTAFPATPASGDSVYAGTGITIVDTPLVENQLYYYSLWSKSSADVYSDIYVTISATPSGDVLSAPDVIQIIDVKVFKSYDEYLDQIYLIRYKLLYNAGNPIQDCGDYFNFELLDGTTLKAQVPVESWGYRPGHIYQSALSAPDWGGNYTVKLRGSDIAWGSPPVTQWNLTSGDWMGADLTQLDTWVITVAESLQAHYEVEYVIYAATGTVLSTHGGIIFNMGIPGLSSQRPGVFSAAAEFPGAELTEHDTSYAEDTMKIENLGPYIAGLIEESADYVNLDTLTFGGLMVGGLFISAAALIGLTGPVGLLIGGAVATPVLIAGAYFNLLAPAFLMVLAFILVFIILKRSWLGGI